MAVSLSAQQIPIALDPQWEELAEGITFQVTGDKASYSLDIEDCVELSTQCIVVTNNGATVYFMYSLDATTLRGQRVRFAASMRVDFPGTSLVQLFVRVDRSAGVGFHEYTPLNRDEREWSTRELIGTIDEDAKRISIGMRFAGRGKVSLANPKLAVARD